MFGTLVSSDESSGTLEWIENPDREAAVSRNIRDRIRISCLCCRSRKVRCSGERKGCQRCEMMGLECAYPENRGRLNRKGISRSQHEQSRHELTNPSRSARNEDEDNINNSQLDLAQESMFDDLHDIAFDETCFNEPVFSPWSLNTPSCIYDQLDGALSSSVSISSNSDFETSTNESSAPSTRCHSVMSRSQVQSPQRKISDRSITSQSIQSDVPMGSSLETWTKSPPEWDAITRMPMIANGSSEGLSASRPHTMEPFDQLKSHDNACTCLLKSISFNGKLSTSSSPRDRIDLLLGDTRDAIQTMASLLACERCTSRVEQTLLLAMAARQISVLCEQTAKCYKTLRHAYHGDQMPIFGHKDNRAGSGTPADVSVGTYRANRREKLYLLKRLVSFQVLEFQQYLREIKGRHQIRTEQGQAEVLMEADRHIRLAKLALDSQSSCSSSDSRGFS